MHTIYENEGALDIIGQLPQILYSFIISSSICFLLEFLALTEGIILVLKKIRTKKKFNRIIERLDNKIKIKILLYFFISTIFIIVFWYYISMFCAIYVNTQIHLIKDTLLSFILSLIYPIFLYFIPSIFRMSALSNPKNKRVYFYK